MFISLLTKNMYSANIIVQTNVLSEYMFTIHTELYLGGIIMKIKSHTRIKSSFRFTIFLTGLFLIIFIGLTAFTGIGSSKILAQDKFSISDNSQKYIKVEVQYGDTLWDIASENTSNKTDIRKVIYEIKELNHINSGKIIPGKKLIVPVYN